MTQKKRNCFEQIKERKVFVLVFVVVLKKMIVFSGEELLLSLHLHRRQCISKWTVVQVKRLFVLPLFGPKHKMTTCNWTGLQLMNASKKDLMKFLNKDEIVLAQEKLNSEVSAESSQLEHLRNST
jgi:hypothetical protein